MRDRKKIAGKQRVGAGLPGPGRPRGVPNQITTDLRHAVRELVENNVGSVQSWLDRVAKKQPGRALELLERLMSYSLPKLQRTEIAVRDVRQVDADAIKGMSYEEASRLYSQMCAGRVVITAPVAVIEHEGASQ